MEAYDIPKGMDRKVISVDIDDYIAKGDYSKKECTPIVEMIEKVNELYKKGHIIIYHTARLPHFYSLTYAWLTKNGVFFHAIRMGKLKADVYLDDKNGNINDL